MSTFRLLIFSNGRQPLSEARRHECTWEQFSSDFSEVGFQQIDDTREDAKTYAEQFLAADFVAGATQKKNDFVECVNMYVLDLDGVPKRTYLKIEKLIRDEGLAAIAYTSYSHIESVRACKGYRVRILFPLTHPVPKDDWVRFFSNMRLKFFSCADITGSSPGKGYLLPSIPKKYVGTRAEKITFLREFKGKPIDVDAMMVAYQLEPVVVASRKDRNQPVGGAAVNGFLKRMRKARSPEVKSISTALDSANLGEPYAAKGARDETLFRMASSLAESFPYCDANQLASFFAAGINATRAIDSTDPGPTVEDFIEKISRAQDHVIIEAEKRKKANEGAKKARGEVVGDFNEVIGAYTKEFIQKFIDETGCGTPVDEFSRRLILLAGKDLYYVFTGTGYQRAYKDTLPNTCLTHLSHKAKGMGFDLYHPATETKPPRLKSITDLCLEYGKEVVSIIYRYGVTPHYNEKDKQLVLCECSISEDLQARQHPQVDEWIDTVCATPVDAERLRDWMSQAPDTDKALCALVFVGPDHVGKSAFADGIAKIWGTERVLMEEALDSFNIDLRRTPVVFADENLPSVNGRVPTEKIRSFISSGSFNLNEKGKNRVTLHGHMRVVVALNSMESFRLGKVAHSKQDVQAVASRFLFINVPGNRREKAKALFDYDKFVKLDRQIAEHCLWLYTARDRRSQRFGVETDSYNEIMGGDFISEAVFTWMHDQIVKKTGSAAEMKPDTPACFISQGHLYVNVRRMLENWGDDITDFKPRQRVLLNAVRVVADEEVRVRIGKHRDNFHVVNTDRFRRFVLETQLDTPEKFDLMMRISTELPHHESAFKLTQEQRDERDALLRRFNMGEPVEGEERRAAE